MKTFEQLELGISPAPWETEDDGVGIVTKLEDEVNAEVAVCEGGEADLANARLIAAAPDLYEALRGLIDTLYGLGFQPILDGDPLAVSVKCGEFALHKAGGESEAAK